MKKIIQATALILMAAIALYAASHHYQQSTGTCHHEWEMGYKDGK